MSNYDANGNELAASGVLATLEWSMALNKSMFMIKNPTNSSRYIEFTISAIGDTAELQHSFTISRQNTQFQETSFSFDEGEDLVFCAVPPVHVGDLVDTNFTSLANNDVLTY